MLSRTVRYSVLRLVVIGLLVAVLSPAAQPAAAQDSEGDDDGLKASTLTVNVELILDASGSMAETIPGSESQSRMDAAKAALRDVIDRIPARDGLNVGFRLYGHKGSNDEADRAVSCQASDLLVPLDGVDKERLLEGVDGAQPTGWTPLAYSLEQAAGDFTSGGESVTNAVIMVTDGEDTCGGDPCALAGQFHAADVALTTHVVGFALSPEQQEAVRCIAEEGGGDLFTAEDADSLGDAVFSAFSQVDATPVPVEAAYETGGYVGGNAFALLDEGQEGELSVVAVGVADGDSVPIVIKNNTGADVESVEVEAVVRVDGELVAAGGALDIQPAVVKDGAVGLGTLYFSGTDIPEGAEFTFQLSADPAGTDEITSSRDLVVDEVNRTDDGVVGIVSNPHEETVSGIIIFALVCFDASGQAVAFAEPTGSADGLETGDTMAFNLGIADADEACPYFLVAAYGSGE